MAEVAVKGLTKRFGTETLAVDDISFTVVEGEFVTLLGPSGCGKTTTLRCIAGLETPDEGVISIGGEIFTESSRGICAPPEKRRLGMVFQSYAIWPHMSVAENVAYGLQAQRTARSEVKDRVQKALDLVGLGNLGERNATKLSGGQQQRVALARALVYNPRVLLFDEPLSNLDAKLRERMRLELASMVRKVGITSIYVTHDQAEAMVMSDRIIVMNDGRIQQEGDPHSTYEEPANSFVADFIGIANIMEGVAAEKNGDGGFWVDIPALGSKLLCLRGTDKEISPGSELLVIIRPEYIEFSSGEAGEVNSLKGILSEAVYLGQSWECRVQVKDLSLRVQVRGDASLEPGQSVSLSISPSRCVMLKE